MPIPPSRHGLGLVLPSMLTETCRLGTALALRHSKDSKMVALLDLSSGKIPFRDLLNVTSRKKAAEDAKAAQIDRHAQSIGSLKVQSILHKALVTALSPAELAGWSENTSLINPQISIFARKALLRCLPTNSNLHLWGKTSTDLCPRCCNQVETENHILNNCAHSAEEGRYTWRHNAVLKLNVAR